VIQNIVFRGCMRPQLLFGIPMVPLILAFGFVFLLVMWFTIKLAVLAPILYVIMRTMVKIDEHIFDLLGSRMRVSVKTLANAKSKNGDLLIGPHSFDIKKQG
jgi:type IV secretory pathway VirB3-like protein